MLPPRLSTRLFSTTARLCARPPTELLALSKLDSDAHHALASAWVRDFVVEDIPRSGYTETRSRSSGPGGQHVNKTESKVTLRCELDQAVGQWLPKFVMPALVKSPYYHPSPPCILVSSQKERHAPLNHATALGEISRIISQAAKSLIINPTSPQQKARVKDLERREKAKRMELKKRHSMKKASRRE
ncbi:hypothetical protein L202_04939 [Cryptococcus amylolentus CBS 6039]|uniref:Prokaryotic-type class I peptide chain release factors domain-containing protein n=2 Tax=Cryptococcus amylolentus TaxID=104669 RepID=A0A1E3HNA1_9TREE|nr:hypothetical protein L202_04939 [Cryptococcus amylolentus CBS 6039]ODN77818.1 hypothetical protein L202_04939 [Cryptococcus amylolentus CBS 6039]ODO05804.1 hypothetical protein I350_04865 [Cryptococcus amylolentus CBS 6273]